MMDMILNAILHANRDDNLGQAFTLRIVTSNNRTYEVTVSEQGLSEAYCSYTLTLANSDRVIFISPAHVVTVTINWR